MLLFRVRLIVDTISRKKNKYTVVIFSYFLFTINKEKYIITTLFFFSFAYYYEQKQFEKNNWKIQKLELENPGFMC